MPPREEPTNADLSRQIGDMREMVQNEFARTNARLDRLDTFITGGDEPERGLNMRVRLIEERTGDDICDRVTALENKARPRRMPWWQKTVIGGLLYAAGVSAWELAQKKWQGG